jgi:hypothetical protein
MPISHRTAGKWSLVLAGGALLNAHAAVAQLTPDQQSVVQLLGMKSACIEVFPELKQKLEAAMRGPKSGLTRSMRQEMARIEGSKDPRVQGWVEGAAAVMSQEKRMMEVSCQALVN